jgi:hypothetical protein
MREHLYRAKSCHNSITGDINRRDWVYGFIHERNGHWSIERKLNPGCNSGFSVIKETIGQYTGRKEWTNDGAMIFEWDIADFTVFDCFDNDTQYRGVVVYNEVICAFELWKSPKVPFWGSDGPFSLGWVLEQDVEFEIIGNIYDNPSLLEKAP